MSRLFLVVFVFLTHSCTKDYKSETKTYLNNQTNHEIAIVPYYKGRVDSDYYRYIQPFEQKMVYDDNVYGKTLSPDFGTLLQPYDSVLVFFDGQYKSTHMKFNTPATCEKCIDFKSDRNISNPDNYSKVVTKETKHNLIGYYTYSFSESDYLKAKN